MLNDDDPGWPIGKELLLGLIPGVGRRVIRKTAREGENGLALLRQVFMSFCLAIILFGVVLAFLWPSQSKEPEEPGFAAAMVAFGVVAGIAGRFVERPLVCTDDASLAVSYRSRFFVRIAFAEMAALFGFVGFFVASVWWVYPAGAAIAFLGFTRAAPTRTQLRRDQERLNDQGGFRSLVGALTRTPPSAGRRGSLH